MGLCWANVTDEQLIDGVNAILASKRKRLRVTKVRFRDYDIIGFDSTGQCQIAAFVSDRTDYSPDGRRGRMWLVTLFKYHWYEKNRFSVIDGYPRARHNLLAYFGVGDNRPLLAEWDKALPTHDFITGVHGNE